MFFPFLPGLQGNPIEECIEVECQRDEDCDRRERCNYLSKSCVPLCQQGGECAPRAECQARDHREFCTCPPPLEGDGYTHCEQREFRRKNISWSFLQHFHIPIPV